MDPQGGRGESGKRGVPARDVARNRRKFFYLRLCRLEELAMEKRLFPFFPATDLQQARRSNGRFRPRAEEKQFTERPCGADTAFKQWLGSVRANPDLACILSQCRSTDAHRIGIFSIRCGPLVALFANMNALSRRFEAVDLVCGGLSS